MPFVRARIYTWLRFVLIQALPPLLLSTALPLLLIVPFSPNFAFTLPVFSLHAL